MRLLISFTALFLAIIFVQLGSGTLGPLDALAGAAHGFTTGEIGLLGSAHFAGFFVGCWIAPRMMGSVGHSRAFAVFASIGAMSALLHPIFVDPLAWSFMRVGSGISVAGAYTVIEGWLQAKVTNDTRGRVLGVYRTVDLCASLTAQLLIAVLDPLSYVAYNLIAMFCCLCLLPLALTTRAAPEPPKAPRLRPIKAILLSPLAAFGVVVVGLTNSSFRMVGPVFGAQVGLSPSEIGLFLASGVLGGAVAQIPVGWLADKFDRRWTLIVISLAAFVVCTGLAGGAGQGGGWPTFAASFVFGMAAFPLYSISAALANDRASPDFIVELNASLVLLFGVGAIVSPLLAASLIEWFGSQALFAYIASAHLLLVVFGLYRMTRRATPPKRGRYRYLPRTSFLLTRLFRKPSAD